MLRNVDWTLLGQIEFGMAELRHPNCATLRTCILRFADFLKVILNPSREVYTLGSLLSPLRDLDQNNDRKVADETSFNLAELFMRRSSKMLKKNQ